MIQTMGSHIMIALWVVTSVMRARALIDQIRCINPPMNAFMNHSLVLQSVEAIPVDTVYVNRYAITNKMQTKFHPSSIVKIQLLHEHSIDAWNISTFARRKTRIVKSIHRSRWEHEQSMHTAIFQRVVNHNAKQLKVPRLYHSGNESFFVCGDFSRQYEYGIAIMEYVDGVDLWTILTSKTHVPLLQAVRQSAMALAALHSHGIVHGDYHSPNILFFNDTNRNVQVAVIDFTYSSVFTDAFTVPCNLVYEDISYYLEGLDDMDTLQAYQAHGIFTQVICHEVTYSCIANGAVREGKLRDFSDFSICNF